MEHGASGRGQGAGVSNPPGGGGRWFGRSSCLTPPADERTALLDLTQCGSLPSTLASFRHCRTAHLGGSCDVDIAPWTFAVRSSLMKSPGCGPFHFDAAGRLRLRRRRGPRMTVHAPKLLTPEEFASLIEVGDHIAGTRRLTGASSGKAGRPWLRHHDRQGSGRHRRRSDPDYRERMTPTRALRV